ncbi:MAG: PIN domain-containing protein [Deltaproteobacteria bacterium]|nr:PIN domain-containing protein [Deltaproteobacteria bacterium]
MALPAKVLVDTSVFVEFFRGREVTAFQTLLLNNQILLSSYVRLELLQGVPKQALTKIEYVLGGLEKIQPHDDMMNQAEALLTKVKGSGLTLGIVDLLIAAESILLGAPIYSLDKIFSKLGHLNLISLFEP